MKNTVDRSELPIVEKDTSGKIILGRVITTLVPLVFGYLVYVISLFIEKSRVAG